MATRPKVYVTFPALQKEPLQLLQQSCDVEVHGGPGLCTAETFKEKLKTCDGVIIVPWNKVDEEVLQEAGPQLKVISTHSVGYDHIDLDACKRHNITIGYCPDVVTDGTAETAIALCLMAARRLPKAVDFVRKGEWLTGTTLQFMGPSITKGVIGIVGLGRIGQAVAQRVRSFGPDRILYSGRNPKPEASALGAEYVSLDELLAQSDFVILSCAYTKETHHLFNADLFNKMKPTAVFVNVSRGGAVDQDALYTVLNERRILAAGLDVVTPEPLGNDHPLTQLENCVIIPHIGSLYIKTLLELNTLAVRNCIAGVLGQPLPAKLD